MLLFDTIFALFVTILFYIFLMKEKSLNRFYGSILLFLYVTYMVSLTFRETVIAYFGG